MVACTTRASLPPWYDKRGSLAMCIIVVSGVLRSVFKITDFNYYEDFSMYIILSCWQSQTF